MFASLPMYDWPETRGPLDRFYRLMRSTLAGHGIAAPDALDHDTPPLDGWRRADLVLGQICNLPLRAGMAGDGLTRIGACDYGVPDVPPGHYCSVFVVRDDAPADDPMAYADGILAINGPDSQSGWGAPQALAAQHGRRWTRVRETGAHAESARCVAEGRADIAALDAITWTRHVAPGPLGRGLRVIGRSLATPGMTLITRHPDPAPFRHAVAEALSAMTEGDRDAIGLTGVVALPDAAYDLPLPDPPPK